MKRSCTVSATSAPGQPHHTGRRRAASPASSSTSAPGPIAWATYAGRAWAEGLDQPDRGDALAFRREITALEPGASLLP